MGERKQLDVLSQEPDPGAEGLTYAELDHQALQAKWGGPALAPESVLYTTINNNNRTSVSNPRPPEHQPLRHQLEELPYAGLIGLPSEQPLEGDGVPLAGPAGPVSAQGWGDCDTGASKCPLVVGSADEGWVELGTGVFVAALRGPHCPNMASALTVLLLSCWLAGRSGISGDAGSIPTGETDLTPTGQMLAPICPSSAVPGGTDLTQPGQMSTSTHPSSTEPEGIDPIQTGQMSTSTHPSSTEPGGPGSPGLTRSIIAGLSAAAAILLLVAFVCFRKIRARRRSALRLSSTIPMVTLKAPAQQDPVYTSVDKGKQPQTLEPNPGADGLIYAELDGQALQAKQGGPAPAPEPAESSMYAVINVNRGPPQ
ncbi:uncharacterized protein LOC122172467 [Chrysemys picta bellii]|uniref:uncharacterized protein LOC122172467 n=1 Tax=Chrysemys picta bellii TaxID=8478 RepID=UPI0032B105BE